ncbi:MAG: S1 RNA-binding domain-containing protein [Planctomycetota bacterium]
MSDTPDQANRPTTPEPTSTTDAKTEPATDASVAEQSVAAEVEAEAQAMVSDAPQTKVDRKLSDKNEPGGSKSAADDDAETQKEIDQAMAELGLGPDADVQPEMPAQVAPVGGPAKAKLKGPRVVEAGREHRTGMVVSVGPTDIFVEFGPKELGVVERAAYNDDEVPAVGDTTEVIITRYEASESYYVCVRPGAVQKADWELLEIGQTVEARVTGVNKGGLELELANHRAFMPASQVSLERIEDLSVFIGEKMTCQVQRVDRAGKGNIVLSRRDMLKEERKELAKKLRDTLKEGDTVEGTVKKIMPFGAFVDIGGIDGLVHVADLSHDRVNMGEKNVERHIKQGEKVRCQVLKVDWDAKRISLGVKQLLDDPFQSMADEIVEGAVVSGRVTKILDFGCFVEVASGVEGLVHISELDWRRVAQVSDVVKPDEVVQVKVLKVDPSDRKVSLSIKQTKEAPERDGMAGRGGSDDKPQKLPKGVKPRDFNRGRMERDTRNPDDIKKETPHLRRMREAAKAKQKQQKGGGGLGDGGGLGIGLGDLKL